MTRPPDPDTSALQPLPRGLRDVLDQRPRPRHGDNLGLWLDKYLPLHTWKITEATQNRHTDRRMRQDDSLHEHAFSLKGPQRDRVLGEMFVARDLGKPGPWRSDATREHLARQQESCELVYGKACFRAYKLALKGRLIVDYARPSPIESSLSFHATLGVPRIPGSAFKGLLRAFLRPRLPRDELADLFGAPDLELDEPPNVRHSRGRLVLHDALPEDGKFQLDLDGLTPHFREYYENLRSPADWLSPVPHGFLTVVATTFRLFVGLLPPHPHTDGSPRQDDPRALLDTVERALADALWQEGLGAKRSAAYGRFKLSRA